MKRMPDLERFTLQSTCPRCGEMQLRPHNAHLWQEDPEGAAICTFVCPHCGALMQGVADREIVRRLLAARPPLNENDVATLAGELDRADWFERLVGNDPRRRALARGSLAARLRTRAIRVSLLLARVAESRHRMLRS